MFVAFARIDGRETILATGETAAEAVAAAVPQWPGTLSVVRASAALVAVCAAHDADTDVPVRFFVSDGLADLRP